MDAQPDYGPWAIKVHSFFHALGRKEDADLFATTPPITSNDHARHLGRLDGLIAKLDTANSPTSGINDNVVSARRDGYPTPNPKNVFVVHGHDDAMKEKTARFLSRLGLNPIILHEQPNEGRTIIEKFETYSAMASFAVILLTPDDVGGVAGASPVLKPRARQNVVLELGSFMGKLGRLKVCALHTGSVELPSDYQGVVYVQVDSAGAWKARLAQELVQAALPIELAGLLNG